ncbi:kinase-like domain-containing protein [Lactarius pseudohatsudake]|nr:kinase-like domain-containing protein [Lactarius pseudohatsudake]
MQVIEELNVMKEEVLFVQASDFVLNEGHFITSRVNEKYEDVFLQADTQGNFTIEDFYSNRITFLSESESRSEDDVPKFVEKHEETLGRKRKADDKMRAIAETLVDEATSKEYFDYSRADISEPTVNRHEVIHFCHVSSVPGEKYLEKRFKGEDANWLFFDAIAQHFKSLPSNITGHGARITVRFASGDSEGSWRFPLIVRVGTGYHTYRSKSDFLVLKFGLPRVGVAINAFPPDQPAVDHHCLVLQGASVVRFANTYLDAYRAERDFIFVAIFVGDIGVADRYLMYQTEGSQEVFLKKRAFDLKNKDSRVKFALEFYNLASALKDKSDLESKDTRRKVEEFEDHVYKLSRDHNLSRFTIKTQLPASTGSDEGNQPGSSVHQKGDTGDATGQLEACGYAVVPDVIETDHGIWELVGKLPPHIRTVYRRSDRSKKELIAKRLRKGSVELHILKHLHSMRPQSPHIISLIETIPSTTGGWLILPKLHSICDQRFMNCGGLHGRVQLGQGLIKGLAYLHEHNVAHRDIKPGNLVCDNAFHLQIIDFDAAVQVQDENTETDEYRGTEDWTAPEMGKEDGPTPMHSPIKADRWSCGRVLLRYIMLGKGDSPLFKFAEELMADEPKKRPSLLEWDKWSAALYSDMANVLGKEVRSGQDIVEVDGESMKPPDAKKPRLEVTEQGSS